MHTNIFYICFITHPQWLSARGLPGLIIKSDDLGNLVAFVSFLFPFHTSSLLASGDSMVMVGRGKDENGSSSSFQGSCFIRTGTGCDYHILNFKVANKLNEMP